ncbi:ADOP family duplicated permease [Gemmatimonadota bacterium]
MKNPSGWKRLVRLGETIGQRERNIDEEIQFHIEGLTEKLMAQGMGEEEARAEALRRFGALEENLSRIKRSEKRYQSKQGGREFLASVMDDIRLGFRSFVQTPGFTLMAVLLLGLGIGANTAMFSVLQAAFMKQLPYEDPDRLVFGRRSNFAYEWNGFVSAYDYFDHRERSQSFTSLAAVGGFAPRHTITGGEEAERASGVRIGWDLFQILGVEPQVGRSFTHDEGEPGGNNNVVMISHGYWQRRFGGSSDALGSSITVDGTPHAIVGVMPAGFRFLFDADFWRPMFLNGPFANGRQWHNWHLVGRLRDGVTIEQAQAEVELISRQLEAEYPDTNRDKALRLTALHSYVVEGSRTNLLLLMAALGLVLLIACSNVAGLLLARGTTRQTEMAVRSTMGASRGRLIRQLLTETMELAFFAGVLGILLAVWLQDLIPGFLGLDQMGITGLDIETSVLLFAIGISFLTGLLFGAIPALRGTPTNLADHLKTGYRTTDIRGGSRFRNLLVVLQVALSVLLLVGSGLLIRSLTNLMRVDPGFDTSNLLTAGLQLTPGDYPDAGQRIQFYTTILQEVRALPDVRDAGLITMLPMRDPGNDRPAWNAEQPPADPNDRRSGYSRVAMPGYFEVMGIPLLAGRSFEDTDNLNSPGVLLINESMARTLFPDQNPVGRRVAVDFGQAVEFEVIGVVGDVRISNIASDPRMAFYLSYMQAPQFAMRLAVRTAGDPTSIVTPVRNILQRHDPNVPLAEPGTMESIIADFTIVWRVITALLLFLSLVAFCLAVIGLYGVLAFYVNCHSREIGVRMALGAQKSQLLALVVSRGMALTGIGLVAGIAGALAATRLLRQLLFNTAPTDVPTFVSVSLVFLVVALLACLLPGWRAMKVDPVVALQSE